MKNPKTMYRIELMLNGDLPHEVLAVLQHLTGKQLPLIGSVNHPFFFIPGWSNIFYRASSKLLRKSAAGSYSLRVSGESDLEEQDIGLFLRWLTPYIRDSHRPRRIAAVRNRARRQSASLNYFICNGKINAEFVDQPLHSLTNFQLRAVA